MNETNELRAAEGCAPMTGSACSKPTEAPAKSGWYVVERPGGFSANAISIPLDGSRQQIRYFWPLAAPGKRISWAWLNPILEMTPRTLFYGPYEPEQAEWIAKTAEDWRKSGKRMRIPLLNTQVQPR